jgi:hypothetical protein
MRLEGSCHCGLVRFSLNSAQPQPYQRCYCICRKTQGGGGYSVNLGGDADTLAVEGREHVSIYHARILEGDTVTISPGERHFCSKCGSALWVWDPRWPELVHPFASAIDTALPVPKALTHILLADRAPWVTVESGGAGDLHFEGYPEESLAEWHERLGVTEKS